MPAPYIFPNIEHEPRNRESYRFTESPAPTPEPYRLEAYAGRTFTQDLRFEGGQWTDLYGVVHVYPEIKFPGAFVSLSFSRQLVKTALAGYNGTVKEYASEGDTQVSISTQFIAERDAFPYDPIAELVALLSAPVAHRVYCPLLRAVGINAVVVESYKLPAATGRELNIQRLEISCLSDRPIELQPESL